MSSKRVHQICSQLTGLLGLLVQMQATPGDAGNRTHAHASKPDNMTACLSCAQWTCVYNNCKLHRRSHIIELYSGADWAPKDEDEV